MSGVFPIIFGIAFVVIFVFIIVTIITRFVKNENSPIVATQARLVDKKSDFSTYSDANGMAMHSTETLYLIFELDTGSTMRFTVGSRAYHSVRFQEWGTLTFQGTRFLRFESMSGIVEN